MGIKGKQRILNVIIIISLICILLIIGFVIYPDIVKTENEVPNETNSTSTITKTESTSKTTQTTQETQSTQTTQNTEQTQTTQTTSTENNNYIGNEEKENENTEDVTKEKEDKAIELAKQKWDESDTSVTYSIEQKNGDIYYIAVKNGTEVKQWYEVDTTTWKISEY